MSDDKNLEKDTMFTDEEILGHDYDGIKEMNNGMPFWITGLFIGSIIWGVIYYIHYTSGSGPTQDQVYQADMSEFKALVAANDANKEDVDYFASLNNPEGIAKGKKAYKIRCEACHGAAGQGGIGPNLTDAYWIHGDQSLKSIYAMINEGFTEKGMPAWGQIMSEEDMVATAYFVQSTYGTKPESAKKPQGKKVEEQ